MGRMIVIGALVLLACSPAHGPGPVDPPGRPPKVAPTLTASSTKVVLAAVVGAAEQQIVAVEANPPADVTARVTGPFTVDLPIVTAAPSGSFTVSFRPTAAGDFQGTLELRAATGASTQVELHGSATVVEVPEPEPVDPACAGRADGDACGETSSCGVHVCENRQCVAKNVLPDGTECQTPCGGAAVCFSGSCAPAPAPLWTREWSTMGTTDRFHFTTSAGDLLEMEHETSSKSAWTLRLLDGRGQVASSFVTTYPGLLGRVLEGDRYVSLGGNMDTNSEAVDAFDLPSGRKLWTFWTDHPVDHASDGSKWLFSTYEEDAPNRLTLLDGATGTHLWERELEAAGQVALNGLHGAVVTAFGSIPQLVVVDLRDGRTVSTTVFDWNARDVFAVDGVFIVAGATELDGTPRVEGRDWAGNLIWSRSGFPRGVPHDYSARYVDVRDGVVVLANGDRLRGRDGEPLPPLGFPLLSNEVVSDRSWAFGLVHDGDQDRLCAADLTSGINGWCETLPTGTQVDSLTLAPDGVRYAVRTAAGEDFVCHRRQDGLQLGAFSVPGRTGPAVFGNAGAVIRRYSVASARSWVDVYPNP